MKTLRINGTPISDYGVFINSDTYLNGAAMSYTAYSIPARNGDLIQYNKKFDNIIRKFECYVPEVNDTVYGIDSVKKLIYLNPGYVTLESDYEPGYVQEGYLAQEIEAEPFNMGKTVTFTLYFSCKPEKWLQNGATATAVTSVSRNDSIFPRNAEYIQSIFSQVDSGMISDAPFFRVISLGSTSVSSWSASWSEGNMNMYLAEGNPNTKGDGEADSVTATNTSFSSISVTATNGLYLVVPYANKGTLTYGSTPVDLTANTGVVTEPTALGSTLEEIELEHAFVSAPTPYVWCAVIEGKFLDRSEYMMVKMTRSFMNSSTYTEYITVNYGINHLTFKVRGSNVYMTKTGLPDLDVSNMFDIYGSISDSDTVTIQNITNMSGGSFRLTESKISVRWWKR